MTGKVSVVIEQDEHGCYVWCPELKGCQSQGKTVEEARALFAQFHAQVTGGEPAELPESLAEEAERLEPLTGVKAYPARVKCATLSWHALEAALKGGGAGITVKTE